MFSVYLLSFIIKHHTFAQLQYKMHMSYSGLKSLGASVPWEIVLSFEIQYFILFSITYTYFYIIPFKNT